MEEATADPFVVIEARGTNPDWVRYRALDTGRRWEVHGTCDRRGTCLIGAVVDGKVITRYQVEKWRETGIRPDSEMDVPVTPEFKDICCGRDIFTYVELDPAEVDD